MSKSKSMGKKGSTEAQTPAVKSRAAPLVKFETQCTKYLPVFGRHVRGETMVVVNARGDKQHYLMLDHVGSKKMVLSNFNEGLSDEGPGAELDTCEMLDHVSPKKMVLSNFNEGLSDEGPALDTYHVGPKKMRLINFNKGLSEEGSAAELDT